MTGITKEYTNARARFEELKAREVECCTKLDSLHRMLHRLCPTDHLFNGVIRAIAKWSNEKARTHDSMWDALSEMNRCAQANTPSRPRLRTIK